MNAPHRIAASRRPAWRSGRCALAGLGLAAVFGAAHAGPAVHFDFQAGAQTNTGHSTMFFTSGGVGVTVSAWTTADTPPGIPRSGGYGRVTPAMGSAGGEDAGVYDGDSGLGVFQAGTDSKNLDGGDGTGESDEALMFVFDREVELTAMNFNDWTGSASYPSGSGWGDNLRFFVDGQWVMNYGGISDKPGFSMVGTMFVLTAENDETSVRIQDLDIRVLDVPEPGSWALTGVALAGLFATRRRQHQHRPLPLFGTGRR